jgi:hypothetical protein
MRMQIIVPWNLPNEVQKQLLCNQKQLLISLEQFCLKQNIWIEFDQPYQNS